MVNQVPVAVPVVAAAQEEMVQTERARRLVKAVLVRGVIFGRMAMAIRGGMAAAAVVVKRQIIPEMMQVMQLTAVVTVVIPEPKVQTVIPTLAAAAVAQVVRQVVRRVLSVAPAVQASSSSALRTLRFR